MKTQKITSTSMCVVVVVVCVCIGCVLRLCVADEWNEYDRLSQLLAKSTLLCFFCGEFSDFVSVCVCFFFCLLLKETWKVRATACFWFRLLSINDSVEICESTVHLQAVSRNRIQNNGYKNIDFSLSVLAALCLCGTLGFDTKHTLYIDYRAFVCAQLEK